MKKRYLVLSIIILVFSIILSYNIFQNKELITDTNNKISQNNGLLSIMLETDAESGIYEEAKNNDWPLKGYKFNNLLSKCKNGSEIIWDSVNKRVQVSSITSDKCYVYFDKVILPSIKVSSSSSTTSSITVNVAGTKGTYNIAKYMYSIDNKKTWTTKTNSATTSNNTFSSLASNTEYTIYIKIVDVENNEVEISSKVKTSELAAVLIKNLYTTQGANNLYHHDGTLANGINDGSYRYAGSYETTNNWICFGTNAVTCDDEHLYRIIGVFNNQLKLIKAYEGTEISLGTVPQGDGVKESYYKGKLNPTPGYYWSGSSTNQANIWTSSTLNTGILNGTYLTKLGTTWTNKISSTVWKVGGNSYANIRTVAASTAYQNEVASTYGNKTYSAKIGLMYVTDYVFAASPANWTTNLGVYNTDTNRKNNWIFLGIREWTISPRADYTDFAYIVGYGGRVDDLYVYYNQGVRPTFYLNSNVEIVSGNGTKTTPYRIK